MAYQRFIYGVEYDPQRQRNESEPPWLSRAIAGVVLLALVSLAVTLYSRYRSHRAEQAAVADAETEAAVLKAAAPTPPAAAPVPGAAVAPPPVETPGANSTLVRRPKAARNLLMRLEEAENRRDAALAVETIEQLRELPGDPVADLDDRLARRLGALNLGLLFGGRDTRWIKTVTVKSGDAAARIAKSHGSTLASLAKLNAVDLNRLRVGQELKVMDHPRFSLVVHRRTRVADLSLKGKFFKRYDLRQEATGAAGTYQTPERLRALFAELGLVFADADRGELELLIPAGSTIIVSEL